jgi:hypothetical protein
MNAHANDFPGVLHANGPDLARAAELQLYGQFVGDWDTEVIVHDGAGVRHRSTGEIHFGWVLQGRAVQDVWMIPRLVDREGAATLPLAGNWYGTTLRIYDPSIQAWRIYWIDPATNSFRQQIGRARGKDIVQEGTTDSGVLSRWSFTKVTLDSFHWLGESKGPTDVEWRLVVEVLARRQKA